MILDEILAKGKKMGASDAHLIPSNLIQFRINRNLVNINEGEVLSSEQIQNILGKIKSPVYIDEEGDKYRLSMNHTNGSTSLHIRFLNNIPPVEELGLPTVVSEFASYTNGIVLISGPSNSGRSSTASAILKQIKKERQANIATLQDTEYFEDGIKFSNTDDILNQDIDVCFLDNLEEPILKLASSGKLVIATALDFSIPCVIHNIIKGNEINYRARLLSEHLRSIINQRLIPGTDGKAKLAYEILLPTPEVRACIKTMNLDPISDLIKKNEGQNKMISMNQSILSLLTRRKIGLKDAFSVTSDLEDLDKLLKKSGI